MFNLRKFRVEPGMVLVYDFENLDNYAKLKSMRFRELHFNISSPLLFIRSYFVIRIIYEEGGINLRNQPTASYFRPKNQS